MKTPISYYGGKQELAKKIINLIPSHKTYCEPFIGGAAIFFAKPVSKAEIINDINSEVVNFYEVLKHDFFALQAEIECCDALKIIRQNDNGETFFYLDPPYVGACQGHYDGYSQSDFNELIDLLTKIEGRFLLSSFRNTYLSEASKHYGWSQIELKMNTHPSFIPDQHKSKIEVLTANYPISL